MIRTVGELRDAIADYPDYRPIAGEVPTSLEIRTSSVGPCDEGFIYSDMEVDPAPVDIDENGIELTHVALEGTPPAVVLHGTADYATVLVDPAWVARECDEATAWAIHEIREALATAETHRPCCSTHGRHLTCAQYRRTHFVEVGPCCSVWAALNGDTR